jgi:hypothetical protein
MNAIQMNTSAIISIISVPNIPPAELRTLVVPFTDVLSVTGSFEAHAFQIKSIVISPQVIVFVVVPLFVPTASTFRVILFLSEPIIFRISHHFHEITPESHLVSLATVPLDTALIRISPNESVSPTIAGTKQRPTNSLILNVSSDHPMRFDPATNRKVKRGENIAYTQSFIALTRSIATRARVRSPNTRNMSTAMSH